MQEQGQAAVAGHVSIEIEVDGVSYIAQQRSLTGAAIKALANKPPANVLYRLEGRKRVEVVSSEIVHLHEGEKFVTQPPVGGTS